MKMTTARTTGFWYLGLALSGMLAFLFIKEKIYVESDALLTSANIAEKETLARIGVAAEIALVAFQALTAVWFYKLFRNKNSFAAGLIAVFGMVNAVVILIASAMWLTAINIATNGGDPNSVQFAFDVHENLWVVGGLFFGLWLLPMAYMVQVSKMPRVLAWFLYAGGVGYILATFTSILLPNQKTLTEFLPMAATVGEFWIIGYLIIKNPKISS